MVDDLGARLIAVSELHGEFVLSSGKRSTLYFDKFRFLTDPELLRELARTVATLVPEEATHLAAPEGAAMLLVAAVALETDLPVAVVRKARKTYGTMTRVEGATPPGARFALIEDVSTTGEQVLGAARALEDEGGTIEVVVLAIDRGGGDRLRELGYRVEAIASPRARGA